VEDIEVAGEVGGDDGDEAGARPHWGDEGGIGAVRQGLDPAGGGDILGEIQIVGARRLAAWATRKVR